MRRPLAVLFLALVGALAPVAGHPALAAAGHHGSPAEIFASNNTAIITDPDDPRLDTRLVAFERQVDGIIRHDGGDPDGSTLLDGVFWSSDLQQTTYERSREFEVEDVSPARLHQIADDIRVRFHQESVLTFEPLPRTSPRATGVEVHVAGLDVQRLHDGLVADPAVRDELGGGSVTLRGEMILIADAADLGLVRQFIAELGADPARATVGYGALEFVG